MISEVRMYSVNYKVAMTAFEVVVAASDYAHAERIGLLHMEQKHWSDKQHPKMSIEYIESVGTVIVED